MTVGAIVAGLGTMLMSQTHSVWQFFLFYAVIGAVGNAGLSHIVTTTAIAKWFVRMRGRATGIANTGYNVGEAVMVPIIHLLIAGVGWRKAWMVMGVIPWVVVVQTSLLWMRRAPEDMGLRPDGDPPIDRARVAGDAPAAGYRSSEEYPWTPGAAFRTHTLWLLIIAFSFSSLAVSGVMTHHIPYLTDQGLSPGVAALSFTTYAVFAVFAKLAWGFAAEKVQVRYLGAASFIGSGVALIILLRADTVEEAIVFGAVIPVRRCLPFPRYRAGGSKRSRSSPAPSPQPAGISGPPSGARTTRLPR